jgi:peptidoglycan/LPS O-acetylase OafA/YrhL
MSTGDGSLSAESVEDQSVRLQQCDRPFRPDVEGLRAVAVTLVVLDHAGVPGLQGGFVGVDVFFVISGYVIVSLLIRESHRLGRPQISEFYARRARRILPAASLVAAGSVVGAYKYLGFILGNQNANDARWVAVFLGNVHFAAVGTDYFRSQLPPSLLQNYWSLAVEEQFYVVFPAAMIALCLIGRQRWLLQTKVLAFASAVFFASFSWSIYYTYSDANAAYFSFWTRAWEIALGAVIAAGVQYWNKLDPIVAACIAWVGLSAAVGSALLISGSTRYPGWVAIFPVGGTALAIAGGMKVPKFGPELILGTRPMLWLGKLSFSLYLWHWPVLMLAEQDARQPLSLPARLGLVALSLAGAVVTFYLIENPIRTSRILHSSRAGSIGMGLALIAALLVFATLEIHGHGGP